MLDQLSYGEHTTKMNACFLHFVLLLKNLIILLKNLRWWRTVHQKFRIYKNLQMGLFIKNKLYCFSLHLYDKHHQVSTLHFYMRCFILKEENKKIYNFCKSRFSLHNNNMSCKLTEHRYKWDTWHSVTGTGRILLDSYDLRIGTASIVFYFVTA